MWPFRRRRADEDFGREIDAHLALETDRLIADGVPPAEARQVAARAFGNVTAAHERFYESRRVRLLAELQQDVRYAARTLSRAPGFAMAALVTIALGVGATTATFTLLYAGVLRPLPVSSPEQLVFLEWEYRGQRNSYFSYPHLDYVRAQAGTLSGVAFITGLNRINIVADGSSGVALGELVSGDYFRLLGVQPETGRLLVPDDDRADGAVAVISHRFWRQRFGGDPGVVGKTITVDGVPVTIVGVTRPDFFGVVVGSAIDVRMPLRFRERLRADDAAIWNESWATWLLTIARLQSDAFPAQAEAELTSLLRDRLVESPEAAADGAKAAREARMHVLAARTGLVQGRAFNGYVPALRMLIGIACLVLLIACANVAHLLLARAQVRRKELAIRLAIGATRSRLARQLLTESLLLGGAGGVLGACIATVGDAVLVATMSTAARPISLDIAPDVTGLGFATVVSLIAVLLFGTAPAFHASRGDRLIGSETTTWRSGFWLPWSRTVLTAQMAICMVMLVAAGVFVRSVHAILGRDAGYTRENILMFSTNPSMAGYSEDERPALYSEVIDTLGAVAGVDAVAASSARPIDPELYLISGVGYVDGRTLARDRRIRVALNAVSPGYFSTLRVPLLSGRDFARLDRPDSPKVAIINQTLARELFPGQDPVGRRIGGDERDTYEVVGVVKDTLYGGLTAGVRGIVYVPLMQVPGSRQVSVLLRYAVTPDPIVEAIRTRLTRIDSALPVYRVNTLAQEAQDSIVRQRLLAGVSTLFGGIALCVAAVGLYAAVSCAMVRRQHDIGIRMALGADGRAVLRLSLRESLTPVFVGALLGVPAGYLLLRAARSLLFGVAPADTAALSLAAVVLLSVAGIAGYLPARRAARVDPLVVLRSE